MFIFYSVFYFVLYVCESSLSGTSIRMLSYLPQNFDFTKIFKTKVQIVCQSLPCQENGGKNVTKDTTIA